LTFNWY